MNFNSKINTTLSNVKTYGNTKANSIIYKKVDSQYNDFEENYSTNNSQIDNISHNLTDINNDSKLIQNNEKGIFEEIGSFFNSVVSEILDVRNEINQDIKNLNESSITPKNMLGKLMSTVMIIRTASEKGGWQAVEHTIDGLITLTSYSTVMKERVFFGTDNYSTMIKNIVSIEYTNDLFNWLVSQEGYKKNINDNSYLKFEGPTSEVVTGASELATYVAIGTISLGAGTAVSAAGSAGWAGESTFLSGGSYDEGVRDAAVAAAIDAALFPAAGKLVSIIGRGLKPVFSKTGAKITNSVKNYIAEQQVLGIVPNGGNFIQKLFNNFNTTKLPKQFEKIASEYSLGDTSTVKIMAEIFEKEISNGNVLAEQMLEKLIQQIKKSPNYFHFNIKEVGLSNVSRQWSFFDNNWHQHIITSLGEDVLKYKKFGTIAHELGHALDNNIPRNNLDEIIANASKLNHIAEEKLILKIQQKYDELYNSIYEGFRDRITKDSGMEWGDYRRVWDSFFRKEGFINPTEAWNNKLMELLAKETDIYINLQNPGLIALSDIIDNINLGTKMVPYRHGSNYYQLDPTRQSSELIANYASLRITNSVDALNDLYNVYGRELFEALESMFNQMIN